MHVARVVLLRARHFDLLEAPLRKDGVCRAEVTVELGVSESHARSQRVDPPIRGIALGPMRVVDNLDLPVVILISNRDVAVARHFPVLLRHRRSDCVRVQIPARRCVDQPHNIAVLQVPDRTVRVDRVLPPFRRDDPVVVVVFVVVASYLLLL